ncbi:YqaJ viral recombinase family protein [Microbacterium sp. YJN-G]|uniref:YqaJ viral recombinase family protein n=1 Tax=Microbacterium sp. YJN-G TaxID=2763257 RepID=UPI001877E101|nr:YqaJ viral recombinase family protein [Microbacterium sp. YJN-G]
MTPQITAARVVVPEDAPRTVWMMERGEGVTASEAWEIARGALKTWRRILEAKLNGSRFHGNKATSAGHAREAALLDEAAERMATLTPNAALWAAVDNDLHRATPDAIAIDPDGRLVVVEVKSHDHKWERDDIPAEHVAQMQWQMHVLGADYALYGFEVRDEDDMPPVDGATWIPVPRDDEMIEFLIWRADRFIAWRDAGCPEIDDLPDEVRAALDEWAPLKRSLDAAVAAEKTAAAALKKAIAKLPHAARFGAVGMGASGGFQSVVSERIGIDEAEWEADAPDVHAAVVKLRADLATLESAAKKTYPKLSRSSSLRFQEIEVQDV